MDLKVDESLSCLTSTSSGDLEGERRSDITPASAGLFLAVLPIVAVVLVVLVVEFLADESFRGELEAEEVVEDDDDDNGEFEDLWCCPLAAAMSTTVAE